MSPAAGLGRSVSQSVVGSVSPSADHAIQCKPSAGRPRLPVASDSVASAPATSMLVAVSWEPSVRPISEPTAGGAASCSVICLTVARSIAISVGAVSGDAASTRRSASRLANCPVRVSPVVRATVSESAARPTPEMLASRRTGIRHHAAQPSPACGRMRWWKPPFKRWAVNPLPLASSLIGPHHRLPAA